MHREKEGERGERDLIELIASISEFFDRVLFLLDQIIVLCGIITPLSCVFSHLDDFCRELNEIEKAYSTRTEDPNGKDFITSAINAQNALKTTGHAFKDRQPKPIALTQSSYRYRRF